LFFSTKEKINKGVAIKVSHKQSKPVEQVNLLSWDMSSILSPG